MARGVALAVSSATLAVAAHAAAGGSVPDTGLAAVLTVLLAGAGTALADRRRGPVAILAALGGSQFLLHVLLQALAGHGHGPHHALPGFDPGLMTAAHVGAALLTAGLLLGAERSVFAVATALAMLLPRRLSPLPAWAPLRPVTVPAEPVSPPFSVLLRRVVARRGPPRHS
ncbi:hypothetical protein LX15_004282 [Streptoalloteichus tenebrarius]|uniref:MFS transporter n=1 Tax=Streptoalloteichus tenebrarius (strain ATCC 17920 / DSM 40477 / JCM 4838 / CBS 697.72 / NBRC 16177 / NCIMB 11028 / NRRL B-12390 / A12253. 1 / ISP 5477) TaxID=1933 RepID=A0ABT1HYF7_STRSD|nr:hypothetical protein [Streptoalloteichus tenebrarius]